MFKGFDFNKDFRKIAKKSIYTQESQKNPHIP